MLNGVSLNDSIMDIYSFTVYTIKQKSTAHGMNLEILNVICQNKLNMPADLAIYNQEKRLKKAHDILSTCILDV